MKVEVFNNTLNKNAYFYQKATVPREQSIRRQTFFSVNFTRFGEQIKLFFATPTTIRIRWLWCDARGKNRTCTVPLFNHRIRTFHQKLEAYFLLLAPYRKSNHSFLQGFTFRRHAAHSKPFCGQQGILCCVSAKKCDTKKRICRVHRMMPGLPNPVLHHRFEWHCITSESPSKIKEVDCLTF